MWGQASLCSELKAIAKKAYAFSHMNECVNLVNIQRITKEINEIYRDGSAYGRGGMVVRNATAPPHPKYVDWGCVFVFLIHKT